MKYIIENKENYATWNEDIETDVELDKLLEIKQIKNIRVFEIARVVELRHSPGVIRVIEEGEKKDDENV